MPQVSRTESCWDLAVDAAAHHTGGNRLSKHPVNKEIFQVSTMTALVEGVYDGDTTYQEIMKHGDFGVGTFNALDGEMAAVDGEYFHLHGDGSVSTVDLQDVAPFAAVTFFRGDAEISVEHAQSRDELLQLVDNTVPTENLFYAIRIDGIFASVTTRTVVRQHRPYPSLIEAAKTQVEHTIGPTVGTMVGFRAPQYAQGMTVAGYHLHFIDTDRRVGGHVLDFMIESGTVTVDQDTDMHVEMPTSPQFLRTHLSAEGVADQIEKTENASGHSG